MEPDKKPLPVHPRSLKGFTLDERFLFNGKYTTLREVDEELFLYPTRTMTAKGWLFEALVLNDDGRATGRSWCLTEETYKLLQYSTVEVVNGETTDADAEADSSLQSDSRGGASAAEDLVEVGAAQAEAADEAGEVRAYNALRDFRPDPVPPLVYYDEITEWPVQ